MASKDSDSIDELGILETRASKHDILRSKRNYKAILQLDVT